MIKLIPQKAKAIAITLAAIFIPMWTVFLISGAMAQTTIHSVLGVNPRELELIEVVGIMGSWLAHANYEHIANNSVGLLGLLFFVGLFEKNIFKLLFSLILVSGFCTWLFGAPNSLHIGASGLVFALFGYVISSVIFARKWLYLIPIVAAFAYYGFAYYSGFFAGLVPEDGISFAGHFGGIVSGMVVGKFHDPEPNNLRVA